MEKILIQELTSPGCTMCAAAQKILEDEIKPQYENVEVEYIEATSEKGIAMLQEHGIMLLPGILVNGELLSFGGLTKTDLIQKISSLS